VWHTSSVKRLAHKFPGLITEDGRLAGVEGGAGAGGGGDSPNSADQGGELREPRRGRLGCPLRAGPDGPGPAPPQALRSAPALLVQRISRRCSMRRS
jgi:hypothetical protein